MKFLLSSSVIAILFLSCFAEFGLTSCTKDKIIYDTVTVVKKDTVVIKDTVLTSALLTAHAWKKLEIRGVFGGDTMYYLRGGSNNTQSFDNDYTTFYADGTGLNIDAAGSSHLIKEWKLVTTEKNTQLTYKYFVTNSSIYHFITEDNIRFKNNNLWYDEYYHDNYVNKNFHGQIILMPK